MNRDTSYSIILGSNCVCICVCVCIVIFLSLFVLFFFLKIMFFSGSLFQVAFWEWNCDTFRPNQRQLSSQWNHVP